MRKSRQATAEGRDEIVSAGARLIRERGLEGASVADIMSAAGRTHGGFYRHFPTKTALLAACLERAFEDIVAMIPGREAGATGVAVFADHYLSDRHIQNRADGCPAAALVSEISRGPEEIQAAFRGGLATMTAALFDRLKERATESDAEWMLALMIGVVSTARTLDPVASQRLRETARDVIAARLSI